jgi:hypothetical protein
MTPVLGKGTLRGSWGRVALAAIGILLGACSGGGTRYAVDRGARLAPPVRIALLPLVNLSEDADGPEAVANMLWVELLRIPGVELVERGVVEAATRRARLLYTDRLSAEQMRQLADSLGTSYLMVGTVLGYGFVRKGREEVPTVSLALRLLDTRSGKTLWAVCSTHRGDERESLFGIGRERTLEEVTQRTVRDALASFRKMLRGSRR